MTSSDENRPSWRPQEQEMDRDRDERGMRHWDESRDRDEAWRQGDRYAQGQSGYQSGRQSNYRSASMDRNLDFGRADERDRYRNDERYSRGSWQQQGDAPRGYGYEEGDRSPGFVQHTGYRGGSAFGRMDTGYDRQPGFDRGQDRYGSNESRYNERDQGMQSGYGRGYGQMDQGNYGQSGRQDSFGQGNFNERGTPNWSQQSTQGYNRGMRMGGHRGKGPHNFVRSDERLKEHVSEMLTEHDEIDASNLEVQVRNGEVTLTGTVDDRHQRRLIEDLVEGVSGVKEVHMSIKLSGDHNTSRSMHEPVSDPKKARA